MIRVCGLKYRVALTQVDIRNDQLGETVYDDCAINIRAHMALEKQQQTLWHEITHIIMEGEETGRKKYDEAAVTRISNILWSILDDNQLLKPDWWQNVVDEQPSWSERQLVATRGRKARRTHE